MKANVKNLLAGPALTMALVMALMPTVPAHAGLKQDRAPAAIAAPRSIPEPRSEPAPGLQYLAQTDQAVTNQSVTDPAVAASPPAPAQPVVQPLPEEQLDRMLQRGEALLMSGNITAARLLFERVDAAGDPRAAIWIGMTYDPQMYARLPVAGMKPDIEQAEFWYRKAGSRPIYPAASNNSLVAAPATSANSRKPGSPLWNAACARKYRSFEPETGEYTSFSGEKKRCRPPKGWESGQQ